MKARSIPLLTLAVILALKTAYATSLMTPGPLGEVDRASIDVMIGDALGVEPDRGEALFDGDTLHAERLKSELARQVAQHHRTGGIQVEQASPDWIRFGLFGGKFSRTNNKLQNFFMVQVQVCLHGETLCSTERTVLGVSSDAGLSKALINAATSVVDDFMQERKMWRASKHESSSAGAAR